MQTQANYTCLPVFSLFCFLRTFQRLPVATAVLVELDLKPSLYKCLLLSFPIPSKVLGFAGRQEACRDKHCQAQLPAAPQEEDQSLVVGAQ